MSTIPQLTGRELLRLMCRVRGVAPQVNDNYTLDGGKEEDDNNENGNSKNISIYNDNHHNNRKDNKNNQQIDCGENDGNDAHQAIEAEVERWTDFLGIQVFKVIVLV